MTNGDSKWLIEDRIRNHLVTKEVSDDAFASPIDTGADHPITLARCPSHVVVRGGSLMIAESDRALEMREASYQPVFYIPLDYVDRLLLGHSDHHTYCPYKGEASYYDILDNNGTELRVAVWYYDDPFPAVAAIKSHVAFYADRVTVSVEPSRSSVRIGQIDGDV